MGIGVKTSFQEDVGSFVINAATMLLSVSLRGIVLSYMWLWFLVPLGLPVIGVLHALGISVIVTFLTFNPFIKHEMHPKGTKIFISIFFPLVVFIFGYLYHFGV